VSEKNIYESVEEVKRERVAICKLASLLAINRYI
jgi:hypothetical protein